MKVKRFKRISLLLMIAAVVVLGPAMTGVGRGEPAGGKFPPIGPLPPVPVPKDNPMSEAKVELGKMLFFDTRLSGDASISCADCHRPEQGWGEGSDLSKGYPGTVHWRNSQTVLNSAYYAKLFWEGSVTSLEAQAVAAATGGVAGNGDDMMMEERLRQVPEYVRRFKEVFGTELPLIDDAWRAIAAFERTIVSRNVPFDRYMKGEKGALSEKARQGMELFQGKAGCIQCHNSPLFSDESYYHTGVPDNPVFQSDPLRQITFRFEQYTKQAPEPLYRVATHDYGLYYRTQREEDKRKFRVPTLRDLKYTPPYMHSGVFFALEEVVDFYDRGGEEGGPNKSPLLKPLNLTAEEKEALVAFLESLSGDEIIVQPPKLPDYAVVE